MLSDRGPCRQSGESANIIDRRHERTARHSRRSVVRGAVGASLAAFVSIRTTAGIGAVAQATLVAASAAPVAIGAVYNLSGGLSPLDLAAADGSTMAMTELNAAGGVRGQPLELRLADGKTDLAIVTKATRELIEEGEVTALIGLTDPAFALAAAAVAQEAGVPFLTVGATAPVVTLTGDYVFMLAVGDNVQAAAGAEFAHDRGWTTCGLMLDNETDSTRFLAWYFVERFEAADIGGQIVTEVIYATGETDFSAQLSELHELDPPPDFLYITSGPQEAGTIVKQAREIGIDLPIVGSDGFDTPLLLEQAGEAANNVFFTTHQGVYGEQATAEAFRAAYEAAYGSPPPSVYAALGYDGALLMADAVARAGRAEPAAIRDALAATDGFAGVTGTVTYEAGTRVPNKGCALIAVRDGEFVLIGNVTPEQVPPVQSVAAEGES